ncbi:MAG: 2-hydroxyhepta-2,4-diene-1,7-dioate isomerase, partial [Catenulispora sp.]|nr:2-hydroxyhepta-2,4-diene-1,7-dioate isomerase [Catenulispora sp.]
MKLLRVGPPGAERPAVLDTDGEVYGLRHLTADIDGAFLADGGLSRIRAALAADELPQMDITDQRIGAPVARPGKV